MFSVGLAWDNFQYAIALMSVNKHNIYKICELIESDYFGENQLEYEITQALRRNFVSQDETPIKITSALIGEEIFQRNKYGYWIIDFKPVEDVQRLNLKFQNDEIIVDSLISQLVTQRLADCTDFKYVNLCVQALAIALKDFAHSNDLPISVPRTTGGNGWLNFQF